MTSNLSDLRRAKRGDPEAWNRLLEKYRTWLRNLARQMGFSSAASDLAQEACLEAYKAREAFEGRSPSSLKCWLRAVLRSCVSALIRNKGAIKRGGGRRPVPLDAIGTDSKPGPQPMAKDRSPIEDAVLNEQCSRVRMKLLELSREDQTILLLHYSEGLSFPEIAKKLNKKVDTVQKRCKSALKKFASNWGDYDGIK